MQTRIAFLWHMHQPMYVDPRTGESILPWVRLHATHAYYDMARMLERHPHVRATVNFVPSLVEQLEAVANGKSLERFLEASRNQPGRMTPDQRLFVARQFFMADRERCVAPVPRYRELLQKRGDDPGPSTFDDGELLDLQVLFNLAWMGFSARAEEPVVQELLKKGRGFSEADKASLLETQTRIAGKVLPLWRKLAGAGHVELSTTPYFHPILPLLCDSDAARRAMPDAALPPRFSHPEDARRQVALAIEKHEAVFGRRPRGMWPAEGSVSPEALQIFAEHGVKWLASDEAVLFRSEPPPPAHGQLYQAWKCGAEGQGVALLFRDHQLSDRIGFDYSRMKAADAVRDFLEQLRRIAAEAREDGVSVPLIPVILDGENAWEHYEGKGEMFLDQLYTALERAQDLTTATLTEATAKTTGTLTRIHSGSWIDSNYRIWIGSSEDNLAWTLLGQVRDLFAAHEKKGDIPPERLERARQLLLSAEGSDWFWWYGDDFETENAGEFDTLFRDRLLLTAELLGEPPPLRLREPISAQARRQRDRRLQLRPQTAIIHPAIDGTTTSWLEWLGAGSLRASGARGSMYRSSALISQVRYGCDAQNLYLLVEATTSLVGTELVVAVSTEGGAAKEIHVRMVQGELQIPLEGAKGMYADAAEVALPLSPLGLEPGRRALLVLHVLRDSHEVEQVPPHGPLSFEVPGDDLDARAWWV